MRLAHRAGQFLLVSLLALVTAVGAQKPKPPKPPPIMRGRVQDTLGAPLEGAQVEILGLGRSISTSATGGYRIEEIRPGRYWVVVRRIGYAPLRAALSFDPGANREIIFQLEPLPQVLPEVEVRAEDARWQRRYQEFSWRSKTSFGHFLTRDDIERQHPSYLSDVLRRYLPTASFQSFFTPSYDEPSGLMATIGYPRVGGPSEPGCAPAVSINGGRPFGGWAVNDFRPEEVEAVEVYRNAFQVPLQFADWGARCGLVVVWLR
jgi:hypothetical protein